MIDLSENFRLFITGGTGFFGKALIRHWNQRASEGMPPPNVTILTRDARKFKTQFTLVRGRSWISFHEGDVCVAESLPQQCRFDGVLHAAADSTLGPRLKPIERIEQIVGGTKNILDLTVRSGGKRFLLVSSGGVYGPQPKDMEKIPENWCGSPDPLEPENAYSVSKRMAEHLSVVYANQYGFETVIARCFAFVGQDLPMDVHFAIGNFIRDALTNDRIVVKGTGDALRSYLDQRDLAAWLLTILQIGCHGQAYNVGSDQPISIRDLAFRVRDLLAPEKGVLIQGRPDRPSIRDLYIPDIRKITDKLGVKIRYPLDDAISNTVQSNLSAAK